MGKPAVRGAESAEKGFHNFRADLGYRHYKSKGDSGPLGKRYRKTGMQCNSLAVQKDHRAL